MHSNRRSTSGADGLANKIAELEAVPLQERTWADIRELRFAKLNVAARQALGPNDRPGRPIEEIQ